MSPPRVLNRRYLSPAGAVYVGRPTKWGNPFSHEGSPLARWAVRSRAEAVRMHRAWLLQTPSLMEQARQELRGKDLVCWCKPLACHADALLAVANEVEEP